MRRGGETRSRSLLDLEKKQRDVTLLPPIQQFDLETVKVVGVVVDPGRPDPGDGPGAKRSDVRGPCRDHHGEERGRGRRDHAAGDSHSAREVSGFHEPGDQEGNIPEIPPRCGEVTAVLKEDC